MESHEETRACTVLVEEEKTNEVISNGVHDRNQRGGDEGQQDRRTADEG